MAIASYHSKSWTLAAYLLLLVGCGSREIYPVEGVVVDQGGIPMVELKGGAVEFDSLEARLSASGGIDENGRFRLTTHNPGDGARLGKHRVLIARAYVDPDTPVPRVIPEKYERYETSELEAVVEPKNNVIELKVQRLRPRKIEKDEP